MTTRAVTALAVCAAAICSILATSRPAVTSPPTYGTPIVTAPSYGSGIGYTIGQTGTASAADFKRLIELNEESVSELKGMRADLAELKEINRGLATKLGAPVPQAAPKGIDPLTVAKTHCAACHRPGNMKGGFAIVNDDAGTALARFNNRDKVAVKQHVKEGTMPPPSPNRKALTSAEKLSLDNL